MKCSFSEFSYGYACIREAEQEVQALFPLTAAPTQPSLLTEGKVGYDAALFAVDYTLFMQFKRSDYITRLHTSACSFDGSHEKRCSWMHIKSKHHRFEVDTASNQFHALRGYDEEIQKGYWRGDVLYVAPRFHQDSELNGLYFSRDVLNRSLLIRPRDLPADGKVHRISRRLSGGPLIVMSEPHDVDAIEWRQVRDRMRSTVEGVEQDARPQGVPQTLTTLVRQMEEFAWGRQLRLLNQDEPRSEFQRLRAAARRLGGEMLVVGHEMAQLRA